MRSCISFVLALSCAASVFASQPDENADEVAELKTRIELLEAQLKAVTLERDALQKELDSTDDDPVGEKKEVAPLGSAWKGKFHSIHLGKASTSNAQSQVKAREEKNVTFLQSVEIWCHLGIRLCIYILKFKTFQDHRGSANTSCRCGRG
jgi:predicted  nucleic acid-binding Zn-ribbon protein